MKANVPENILSLEACKILKELGFDFSHTDYFKQIPGTDKYEFIREEESRCRNGKDNIVTAYDAGDLNHMLNCKDDNSWLFQDERRQCVYFTYHKTIKFVGKGDLDSLEKRAAEYIVKKRLKLDDEDVRIV